VSEEYITYRCCQPIVINTTNSMTISEKLCAVIEKVNELIDIINGFEVDLEGLVSQEDMNNKYLISEEADFTGTWFDTTYEDLIDKIENGDFSGTWEETSYDDLINKIENGNFTGTWFGETKVSMDNRIKNGDFFGTWNGVSYHELLNIITNGDFQGTWEGQTKPELDLQITGIETSYEAIIALLDNNDQSFITVADFGFILEAVTETLDYGLVTEAVDTDRDLGYIKYPCQC